MSTTFPGLPNADSAKHYHGDMLHEHPGGDVPHDHKEVSAPNYGKKIFDLLIVLVLLYIAFHVGHAEMVRNDPPVCLLGAHWNLWSGWACN